MNHLILVLHLLFFNIQSQEDVFSVKIDGNTTKTELIEIQKKALTAGFKISFPFIKYDDFDKITIAQIIFISDVGKHVVTLDFSKERRQCVKLIRDFRTNAEVVSGISTC